MKLLIIDDLFPQALSAFRFAEFNAYLERFPQARVSATGASFYFINEQRSLAEVIAEYEENYPQFAGRVTAIPESGLDLSDALAYVIFINNAYQYLPDFEKAGCPFVFTLYPGGGFQMNNEASDDKLRKVFASPCFKKVIVTQNVTYKYLMDNGLVDPDKVEFIFGGVSPEFPYAPPRLEKKTFDICFVGHKSLHKGYREFVQMARDIIPFCPDARFHMVGNYTRADFNMEGLIGRLALHGRLFTKDFPPFYSEMDIIVSPNTDDLAKSGYFDGFPTGCCVEAGACGCGMITADTLKQNIMFVDGKELAIIEPTAQSSAEKVKFYYNNKTALTAMRLYGQEAIRKTYSPRRQIEPRIEILKSVMTETVKPMVTVACLAYNQEKFIRQALDGFVMQKTSFPFEVIVHDDASTDGTAEIIREFALNYPRIFKPIYQTENQFSKKQCYPVEFVYAKARGKYIADCDGDDYWTDPEKLQKQVDFMEANPEYSICYHEYYLKDRAEAPRPIAAATPCDYSADELVGFLFRGYGLHTSTRLFRNLQTPEARADLNFVGELLADMSTTVILGQYGKCKFIEGIKPSVYRRYHGSNSWNGTPNAYQRPKVHRIFQRLYELMVLRGNPKHIVIRKQILERGTWG